jgi:hypothetical protein
MSSARLLMDSNAIIDSHTFKCWKTLHKNYSVETVQKCVEECVSGANRLKKVPIVEIDLISQLSAPPHPVDNQMRAELAARIGGVPMDDGERDLMAFVITQDPKALIVCGPDKALVRAAARLKLLDNIVSLEQAAVAVGWSRKFRWDDKNTTSWLRQTKTQVLL